MDAILTFHSIDESGSVLSFPGADLEALLERLIADGVAVVPLETLMRRPEAAGNRVALTFDDGLITVRQRALPILARLRLPALAYVVSDWVGRTNRWPSQPRDAPELRLMDWDDLRAARDAGLEIGAHGATHAPLTGLDAGERETELRRCRATLEGNLNVPVRHFAYPYGAHSAAAAGDVGRHFQTGVTTRMSFLTGTEDPLRLPRLDSFYLRGDRARSSLFAGPTRLYLGLRAGLRRLRRAGAD